MIGVTLKVASILFFGFYDIDYNSIETLTYNNVDRYYIYIAKILLLAPLVEELIFDLPFLTRNKYLRFSTIALLGFVTLFLLDFDVMDILFLLSFTAFFMKNKISKKKIFFSMSIISNALLFASFHLSLNDFRADTLISFISFSSRFGGHLIAIWLVVNFNFLLAVVSHFLWNLITVLLFLKPLNTDIYKPQSNISTISSQDLIVKYQETSIVSKHKIKYKDTTWSCTSCKFSELLEPYTKEDIEQVHPLIYDIKISIYDRENTLKEKSDDLINLLKKENIIKLDK